MFSVICSEYAISQVLPKSFDLSMIPASPMARIFKESKTCTAKSGLLGGSGWDHCQSVPDFNWLARTNSRMSKILKFMMDQL